MSLLCSIMGHLKPMYNKAPYYYCDSCGELISANGKWAFGY